VNEPVKLLFDECVGAHIAAGFGDFLRTQYAEAHEVRHLSEFQKLGTADEIWIPDMASKGFVAVTGDRGKNGRGKKLPLLCVKYSMTHIMFLPSIHSMKSADKIRAVISLWEDIAKASKSPRGSRFMMSSAGTDFKPRMWLSEIDAAEREIAAKYNDGTVPPPKMLF
jgi:hypothetical protein